MPDVSRGFQNLLEVFRGLQHLLQCPLTMRLSDFPRSFQKISKVPRFFQMFPEASRGRLSEGSGSSQRLLLLLLLLLLAWICNHCLESHFGLRRNCRFSCPDDVSPHSLMSQPSYTLPWPWSIVAVTLSNSCQGCR